MGTDRHVAGTLAAELLRLGAGGGTPGRVTGQVWRGTRRLATPGTEDEEVTY